MRTEVNCTLGEGKQAHDYLFRRFEDGKGWWSAYKKDTPTMHVIDTRHGKCDCSGYKYAKPGKKTCRHLQKAIELEERFMSETNGNMTAAIVPDTRQNQLAQIVTKGNLAMLSEEERATYYLEMCRACGLNPATRPFEFINMKGRVVLYALKGCTEQLRQRDGISVEVAKQEMIDGMFIVTVTAKTPDGRIDTDLAAVVLGETKGEDRANLIMKAITKAKRRVTLSICGLGMLDESEVQSIQAVQVPATAEPLELKALEAEMSDDEAVQNERIMVMTHIRNLIVELGFQERFVGDLKKAYNVEAMHELTAEQLADLERRLVGARQKRQAAAQPATVA